MTWATSTLLEPLGFLIHQAKLMLHLDINHSHAETPLGRPVRMHAVL